MVNTLIVSFLPRGERSNTKHILDAFKKDLKGSIIQRELSEQVPPLLLRDNLHAYMKRDYNHQHLEPHEKALLAPFDEMITEIKSADCIVVAFPMYNFSMPAAMKAYFDGILLKGHTWNLIEGEYKGLLRAKKGLVIMTSGGDYAGDMASWEHGASLAKNLLTFAGLPHVDIVMAGLVNGPDKEKSLNKAVKEVQKIAQMWD